jgi:predicted DNA-binding ribbon-helix-helix protein
MRSPVVKHSLSLADHKTSVSLENEFWNGLKNIAHDRHLKLSELIGDVDAQRQHSNLSSALRLFVLEYYRRKAAEKLGGEHSVPPARVLS